VTAGVWVEVPRDLVDSVALAIENHAGWFRDDAGHSVEGRAALARDAGRLDALAEQIREAPAAPIRVPVPTDVLNGLRALTCALSAPQAEHPDVQAACRWVAAIVDQIRAAASEAAIAQHLLTEHADNRPRIPYVLPDGTEARIIFDHGARVPDTVSFQLRGGEIVQIPLSPNYTGPRELPL
jgi:hypothetical protein